MHRILIVVDKPNWAHDYKTRNLQRILGDKYDVVKKYELDLKEKDLEEADLIQIYYWMQLDRMTTLEECIKRNRRKLLLGVCSHIELENERREKGLTWLRESSAVFFVNRLLYNEFSPQLDLPVFYTPNGVDTSFFRPNHLHLTRETLRVGWAGSLKNQGLEQRGFHLITEAVKSLQGCELVTAVREEKWRSHEEMVDFYHSLHVYVCASRNDGTPNPCLEAAACGVPVVTTRVGNMPELIQPGINGYFIERDVTDIAKVLTYLHENEGHRVELGKNIRETIKDWDWSLAAENYHQMYQSLLSKKENSKRSFNFPFLKRKQ